MTTLANQYKELLNQLAAKAAENARLMMLVNELAQQRLLAAEKAAKCSAVDIIIKAQAATLIQQQTFFNAEAEAAIRTWQQVSDVNVDLIQDKCVAASVAALVVQVAIAAAGVAQDRVMLTESIGLVEVDLANEAAREANEAAREAARQAARQANEAAREAARQANEAARQAKAAQQAAREANEAAQQ